MRPAEQPASRPVSRDERADQADERAARPNQDEQTHRPQERLMVRLRHRAPRDGDGSDRDETEREDEFDVSEAPEPEQKVGCRPLAHDSVDDPDDAEHRAALHGHGDDPAPLGLRDEIDHRTSSSSMRFSSRSSFLLRRSSFSMN